MYTVQIKTYDLMLGTSKWVSVFSTDDVDEARSAKQDLSLYYVQIQIIQRVTEETVVE